MSVKNVETLEKNQVSFTVEVGAEQFTAAIEKAYRKMRGKVKVPGFRPGKAPRGIIEKMYGPEIFYDEAINDLLPEVYAAAVEEEALRPVGYPQVELLNVDKDGFAFKATVYVYPEVVLGQYKGLSAPRAKVSVTSEDVDERLAEMAERNARMVSVEEGAAALGHIANIDFEGFLDGKPFDGGKGTGHDLELGSGSFVPGFEDQVVGMTVGEERDIDITFPENYHADLAGKAVVFHVKLNAIKSKEVPELDDEFAKDVSEFDTMEELRKDVEAKIVAEREEATLHAFEDLLMEQVAEGIECDVPAPMVEEQAKHLVENFKAQLRQQGIPYEQYLELTGSSNEAMMDQAREPATRQVRLELALEAIAKAEDIQVSDEDVEERFQSDAKKYGMDPEMLKKYMSADNIREQIERERVLAVVTDNAIATEPVAVEDAGEAAPAEEAAGEAPVEEAQEAAPAPEEKPKRRTRKKAEEGAAEGEEKPKRRSRKKADESASEEAAPAEGDAQ